MRDAFGSTFMFKIIFIFIVMFVTFVVIAVDYAKTFRLKNRVIDIIEQGQFDYSNNNSNEDVDPNFLGYDVVVDIDDYLATSTYNHENNDKIKDSCHGQSYNGVKGQITEKGACILPIQYADGHYYYRVTLYMVVSVPLINYDAIIPISGDTEDFV